MSHQLSIKKQKKKNKKRFGLNQCTNAHKDLTNNDQ